MKKRGNIGVKGIESIRIGDMEICDLPIAECAISKQQLPLAEDAERRNEIKNILVGYPKPSVVWIDARIKECEENIQRIGNMKIQQHTMISEYNGQISLCKFRDEEISRIVEGDEERDIKIKELFKRFPPYKVPAMKQQIIQNNEAIQRADDVIAKEYTSIAEMRELRGLCEQRDMRLQRLGADII